MLRGQICNVTFWAFVAASIATGVAMAETWRANPALVEAMSGRPGVNYREELVPQYKLPELLVALDGKRIADGAAWRARRRGEVLELFRKHVYGRPPGALPTGLRSETVRSDPSAMAGMATYVHVKLGLSDKGHAMNLYIFIPNASGGSAPVFLLLNNREEEAADPTRRKKTGFWPAEEIVRRGYAAAVFRLPEVDPDDPAGYAKGIRGALDPPGERPGDAWGTLSAWAYGAMRAMDYFQTDRRLDASRVAVVGHSRGGKTALWAAAQDERFAMAVSNESGCGGAALFRRRFGETIELITKAFPHWFCTNFTRYAGKEDELPVDQHMLLALIAPRLVYVASADEDLWADPRGEFLSALHASAVWRLFGKRGLAAKDMPPLEVPLHEGEIGYHIRKGGHDLTEYDWRQFLDFADRHLRGVPVH